jgi:hypothetical protein
MPLLRRLRLKKLMAVIRDQTIQDVSQTLLDLIKTTGIDVELSSPKSQNPKRLTLFLYKVLENAYLKNAESSTPTTDINGILIQNQAPLTVDLYYLLTAHSHGTNGMFEAHKALSRAMRVLYDNGILRGSLLHTVDATTGLTADSVLRVTLNPITMEDMTRIWSVFPDTPYEISVTYLVTPVEIESARQFGTAPVVDQIHEQGQRGAELQA